MSVGSNPLFGTNSLLSCELAPTSGLLTWRKNLDNVGCPVKCQPNVTQASCARWGYPLESVVSFRESLRKRQ